MADVESSSIHMYNLKQKQKKIELFNININGNKTNSNSIVPSMPPQFKDIKIRMLKKY